MDLIERYLYAVECALPKSLANRADIVAELGEALRSRIDEREAELGRALYDDELAATIEAFGHPLLIASRYASPGGLVRADLLPAYFATLKFVVSLVVALDLTLYTAIALFSGRHEYFSEGLSVAWNSGFIYGGIVTIGFVTIDRLPKSSWILDRMLLRRWNPRRLPRPGAPIASRFASLWEFLANAFMAFVLIDLLTKRPLEPEITLPFAFTNAWKPLCLTTIVACGLIALLGLMTFVVPHWRRARDIAGVGIDGVLIVAIGVTLGAGTLVSDPHANLAAIIALVVAMAILAGDALYRVRSARAVAQRSGNV